MTTTDFRRARSPEQQEQRRTEILDVARSMLDTMPPAEVSLRELSRQVGLSKSNVVRYFPTREAVFLAVLVDDWDDWLIALEAALPRADARRKPHTQHQLVAATIARTLAEHPRFCDLLVSAQTVLEHNIPLDTALEFKTTAMSHLVRLATRIRLRVPGLDEAAAFEFAGIVWALTAGAWPMAHPSPVVAQVLADPQFSVMCVDFVSAVTTALTATLDGMTRPR